MIVPTMEERGATKYCNFFLGYERHKKQSHGVHVNLRKEKKKLKMLPSSMYRKYGAFLSLSSPMSF